MSLFVNAALCFVDKLLVSLHLFHKKIVLLDKWLVSLQFAHPALGFSVNYKVSKQVEISVMSVLKDVKYSVRQNFFILYWWGGEGNEYFGCRIYVNK
jgi:hypothetical protein